MIYGIGVDIASVARIAQVRGRHGARFEQRVLTTPELDEYRRQSRPDHFLARRFAAKEAFAKAAGTGIGRDLGWHDITIGHDAAGRPLLHLSAAAQALLGARGVVARHLSLSDEQAHAVAMVVLETAGPAVAALSD